DGRVLADAGAKGGGNNEVAYYPEVRPAIGSADNGEAQGPLLLWPELLIEHPGKNPQDIHDSLEIAAAEVVNIVESLAAQGITPPDNPQDPAEIDAFWEQVFDQFRGGRVVQEPNHGPRHWATQKFDQFRGEGGTSDEGCGLTHDVGVDVL